VNYGNEEATLFNAVRGKLRLLIEPLVDRGSSDRKSLENGAKPERFARSSQLRAGCAKPETAAAPQRQPDNRESGGQLPYRFSC
jgi:hypothetical protein